MNKKSLIVLAAAPMLLTSCNGLVKVKFEKFQDKVGAIEEVKKVEKQTIKGKYKDEKIKFVLSEAKSISEIAIATLVNKEVLATYSVAEVEDNKYFVGNGFKVKTEIKTVEWNKYGYVTHYATEDADFTVSYKFAK